ncbi:MAG: Rieske 2Fe-2S domain-containing protein, partial [Gammaproteobacteria bacterium]|nr:Rieske 2Fe-2S domain-containing protein [Gammaproteobacteria bacterium]
MARSKRISSRDNSIADGQWVEVCDANAVEDGSVYRFDFENRSFAIYHIDGIFYATDGYCTHEQQHLEDAMLSMASSNAYCIWGSSISKPVKHWPV